MSEAPRTPKPPSAQLPPSATGATAASAPAGPPTGPIVVPSAPPEAAASPRPEPAPTPPAAGPVPAAYEAAPEGHQPTAPVTTRPRVGPRRTDPMTRMGPWAPLAGALLGLIAGLVVVLILADAADVFPERLGLVFLTVGLAMLGAAGTLLADEVRLLRRGAREAGVRPAWAEATAGLINGLTPARLLLSASAFVLFLAAYVSRA